MPASSSMHPAGRFPRLGRLLRILAAAISAAVLGGPARAADVHVLSAAAMQTVLNQVAREFERTSGHRLLINYTTMGAITQRVLAGETPDLVIGSTASIATLVKEGRIRSDSQVIICKVGVGVVVPTGTPKPTISSGDELARALRAARVIVYADPAGGGAAGIHVAKVIEKLGLAEQLRSKTRFGAGGDVTEVTLAQGQGALGLTQISEIVDKPGAEFVGPLPDELQNFTGVAAGIPANGSSLEAVAGFLQFLRSPVAVATIRARGMELD